MDSCEAKSGHNDDLDLRMLAYVNTIDPNLMCPICRSPFIEPIRLDCDHTFCMTCLESAFETQNSHIKSCPSCRNKCSDRPRSGTGIPRFVHHLLDEQLVYCPNKACAAKVRREGVLHHVQNLCGFSEISCPSQTCSMTTPRFLSTQDCLHTMINCETCNSKVMKVDIQRHKDRACANGEANCKACGTSNQQESTRNRSDERDAVVTQCSAARIGCKSVYERSLITGHEETCPILSILPTIDAMNQRIDQQKASLDNAQLKFNIFETEQRLTHRESVSSHPLQSVRSRSRSSSNVLERPYTRPLAIDTDESATHHLLSLQESLRADLDHVNHRVTDLDARTSLLLLNENLRLKEEMSHMSAAISSLRVQMQRLVKAQFHREPAVLVPVLSNLAPGDREVMHEAVNMNMSHRLSDPSRQDTKL